MSIVSSFFQHQFTMKMYHFQTKKYGAHKAADDYLAKYELNFDRFMEAWQGNHGRLSEKEISIEFDTVDDSNVSLHLDEMISFLMGFIVKSDLSAIRDEMVADLRQLKYLLTFN